MIQLLGLRTFEKDGIERSKEVFFEKKWRVESVKELFANIEKYVSAIPTEERYNMFYTTASCEEERGRIFVSQDILPIDIDDMDMSRIDEYIILILRTLGLDRSKTGIVNSGNGLHFLIQIDRFDSVKYFDETRMYYKAMCGRINQALYMHGLEGQADPVVFSKGRMLRLPMTENRKNGAVKYASLIQSNIEYYGLSLPKLADMPEVAEGEHIHPNALVKLPPPDTKGVLEGCDYITYCYENQASLSEPQWYAMLSILCRLDDGLQLCHEYSKGHSDYNQDKTTLKVKQALDAAGPRTCDNINTLWEGCSTCANYKKCKSPIMLKSAEYIKTKDTGFYEVVYLPSGAIKRTPDFDGLARYFDSVHPHLTLDSSGIVYIYENNHWVEIPKARIHEFAETYFNPKPSNMICAEFESKLKRTGLRSQEWFNPQGYVNFRNCVLELESGRMMEHGPQFGFRYILPYDYDSQAMAPRFNKFIDEIMLGDDELRNVIMEFIGYSISGIDPSVGQKAMILYGNGSNGKSVLLDVLKMLAGKGNYSTVSMGADINKETNRYSLSGKLFNITEETPRNAMIDNTVFKALVSGGEVQARKLYCDSFDMKNYAKIVMACNILPTNYDDSNGMYRRLLIVPFNATFTEETRDPFLVDKLRAELSGIFNLAYAGLKRFLHNKGRFSRSEKIEKQVAEYKQESHPLSFFIEEKCEVEREEFMHINGLYGAYKTFSEYTGTRPVDVNRFSKLLGTFLQSYYGYDCRGRRENVRGFNGIKLKGGNF
jgi:putative DNA primase/helicase